MLLHNDHAPLGSSDNDQMTHKSKIVTIWSFKKVSVREREKERKERGRGWAT